MPAQALKAMQEQLAYWQNERANAYMAGDTERIARCEHFIAQCERVILVLRDAVTGDLRSGEWTKRRSE